MPFILSRYSPPAVVTVDTSLVSQLQDQQKEQQQELVDVAAFGNYSQPSRRGELFVFDPNSASREELERLGLPPKTALTIEKYRNKGGRFRQPEDLQKIWGLPPGFYERVKDFIVIEQREVTRGIVNEGYSKPIREGKKPVILDGNDADSTAFESLPGIGPKLAARIIHFREKLGGFYSVEQVGETYGLPDSTFQKIKHRITIEPTSIRKININVTVAEELRQHPYIRWNLANAIIAYRNQHGQFQSVEQLRKIAVMDDRNFEKLRPYLVLE